MKKNEIFEKFSLLSNMSHAISSPKLLSQGWDEKSIY